MAQNEIVKLFEKQAVALEDFKNYVDERVDDIELRMNTKGMGGMAADRMDPQEKIYRQAFAQYALKGPDALNGEIRNALSVGSNPDGGFWVPPTISEQVIQKLYETSPMRKIANIQTIETDELEEPVDNDETDSGWVGETESRSDTDSPEIGLQKIPLHEQYAMPKATQKALDMKAIVDFETWLVDKIVKKIRRTENTAFVAGTSIMQPKGFTTYTTSTDDDDSRAWGTIQHVVTGADGDFLSGSPYTGADCLLDVVFSLKEDFLENAAWVMQRTTLAAIAKLKDKDGRYLLGTAKLQDKTPFEILGFPVYMFSDMPAYTTTGALGAAFGDFNAGYTIVDHKRGLSVLRDPYTSKPYVKFYATKYCGGAVTNSEAIKFLKFSA